MMWKMAVAGLAMMVLTACSPVAPAGNDNGVNDNSALPDPDAVAFDVTLEGETVVPPVDTAASGVASFMVSGDRTRLAYTIDAQGLSGPATEVALAVAPAGVNGDAVFDLTLAIERLENQSIRVQGTVDLDPADYDDLVAMNVYVRVVTARFPNGELRGQLLLP